MQTWKRVRDRKTSTASSSTGPSRKGYRTDANHQERNGRCIDERRGYPGEMGSVLQLADE